MQKPQVSRMVSMYIHWPRPFSPSAAAVQPDSGQSYFAVTVEDAWDREGPSFQLFPTRSHIESICRALGHDETKRFCH